MIVINAVNFIMQVNYAIRKDNMIIPWLDNGYIDTDHEADYIKIFIYDMNGEEIL